MEFQYNNQTYKLNTEDLIVPQKYIQNVLSKIFIYHSECGICYDNFEDAQRGAAVYLSCACRLGYHRECIQQALSNNNSCPQCRRPTPSIVNFKGNIQELTAYEEFYEKAISVLQDTDKLYFFRNWFEPVRTKGDSLRYSPLVNPFAYREYAVYDPEYQKCGLFRDIESCCVSPIDKTTFSANAITLKDEDTFKKEFFKVSKGIFHVEKWSWDNVVVAGGMPNKIISSATKYYPERSDIDLFVYGKDGRLREDAVRRIIKFFTFYNAWFVVRNAVVDIYVPGYPHKFQLICGNYTTVEDILYSFDLSHIQIAIRGDKILCTPEFIAAMKHQITQIDETKFKMKRLVKLVGTGMSLLSKRNIGDVITFIKDPDVAHYLPAADEKPEEIHQQLCQTYNVIPENVTNDASKCIHLLSTNQDIRAGYHGDNFLVEPKRFTNFDNFNINPTGSRGYHLFKFIYTGLPSFVMEFQQLKLQNIVETDETGKLLSIPCQFLNEEDYKIFHEFTEKIVKKFLDYIKDKPWYKVKTVYRNTTFKLNTKKNGTRTYESGQFVNAEYFAKSCRNKIVNATIVFNGIRCGYQADSAFVDYHFQEIKCVKK
jgi:hypothetical protein